MRHLAKLALAIAMGATTAAAQRGGGHAGGAGHSGGAFAGGFSGRSQAFASSHAAGFASPHFRASASPSPAFSRPGFSRSAFSGSGYVRGTAGSSARSAFPVSQPSSGRAGFGASNARHPYTGSNGYRRIRVWRNGIGYSYLVPAFYGYGYPGDLGYGYFGDGDQGYGAADNSNASTGDRSYDSPASDPQPVPYDQPPSRDSYNPGASLPSAAAAPQSENPLTVVFKDGRPSQEIHNYALTRTTLYVLDDHRRDIPVDEIDLDATERTNREAGVDFQLPVSLR
jgi:hypothetical protein